MLKKLSALLLIAAATAVVAPNGALAASFSTGVTRSVSVATIFLAYNGSMSFSLPTTENYFNASTGPFACKSGLVYLDQRVNAARTALEANPSAGKDLSIALNSYANRKPVKITVLQDPSTENCYASGLVEGP